METVNKERCCKQISWEILYSDFRGIERKTVELLNKEFGQKVLRQQGVYTLYVLPCKKYNGEPVQHNAIVVGTYADNELIRTYIKEEEVSEDGYCLKVVKNPDNEKGSLVLITAKKEKYLYDCAVTFLYEYMTEKAIVHGGLRVPEITLDQPLAEDTRSFAPAIQTRSIFTWGHPINDYRQYIDNMAKLHLNQLIIWNDYVPLNAKEISDYAHSYGIEVIWGYAWGWSTAIHKQSITMEALEELKKNVIKEFEENYAPMGLDGIYFQSFTEIDQEYLGGVLIAKVVTEFVNDVTNTLLEKYPKLKIQFGLHARSVKKHLDELAKVDRRVEILWEDCGCFPYHYLPIVENEQEFEETLAFTEKIITLRGDAPMGLVFKGMMTIDWDFDYNDGHQMFVNQRGPYILGENSDSVVKHDKQLRRNIWRYFYGEWTVYGKYAQRVARLAERLTKGNINLCMVCEGDGGIYLPEAICSEIFWNPDEKFENIVMRSFARDDVELL